MSDDLFNMIKSITKIHAETGMAVYPDLDSTVPTLKLVSKDELQAFYADMKDECIRQHNESTARVAFSMPNGACAVREYD